MKHSLQILFFSLLVFSLNAQTALDTVYQDKDRKTITKEQYTKLEYDDAFIPAYYQEGNKLIKYVIFDYDRTVIDRMPIEKLNELREYLSSLTGKRYLENRTIVIDYFPGEDRLNKHVNTAHQKNLFTDYNAAMSRMPHINQISISKKDAKLGKWEGTTNWIEDAERYIEKNFFPHHYLHSSMIVIKPDGNYVKRMGKYELERSFKEISIFSPPPRKKKEPVQKLEKM